MKLTELQKDLICEALVKFRRKFETKPVTNAVAQEMKKEIDKILAQI